MSTFRAGFALVLTVTIFLAAGNANRTIADEPAAEFLEALREKGYYDIAIKYLTSLESSDLISDEYRKVLPFEKAETLIKSASRVRDEKVLEARLNEAETLLNQFSGNASDTSVAAKTNRYRGNLRMGRSRLYLNQSQGSRLTAQEKKVLVDRSREMLNLALKDYVDAREALKVTIQNFQEDVADPSTTAELKRLRNTYTRIRLRLPVVKEQLADSYPDNDPQRKKLLSEAAKEYEYLFETYRRFAAGLDSGLYAARCYHKIGQTDLALLRLKDLFALSNSSTFKTIKRRALALGVDCWQKTEPYPARSVIKECGPLVSVLTRNDLRNPEWLKVQMELAKAYHAEAENLNKEKAPGSAKTIREYKKQAAKLIKTVSRSPGEFRVPATKLMADWNLNVRELEAEEKPPTSFMEARAKGEEIVTDLQVLLADQKSISARLAQASDLQKGPLQTEFDDNSKTIEENVSNALQLFNLALEFSDEKTELADINKLRYLQSFCYFADQRYRESALIGEFLLERYPTADWTRQASSLAFRSYNELYNKAPRDDRQFEARRMTLLGDTVISRWPGSSECSAAATALTALALEKQDFQTAEQRFDQIQDDYSTRGILGLKIGQKLWFTYSKPPEGTTAQQRSELLKRATSYFEDGLAVIDPDKLTYDAALSALLLVSAHLKSGEVDKAIERLEKAAISPLDLLKQKHPAVLRSSKASVYTRGTYNAAIDAYLAALAKGDNRQNTIDKIGGIIAAIKSQPNSEKTLTNTYRRIGKALKTQFDKMASVDEKKQFSKTLASFLGAIEKDSDDSSTVLWAGSTLLTVANGLQAEGQSAEAKPLFEQAVSALSRAENLGFTGKDANKKGLELQRQKALAQSGSGKYDAAMQIFGEILKKSPTNLDFQLDAATTLHKWATQSKNADKFAQASSGMTKVKDKRTKRETNAIWGWRKIFQVTRGKEKYKEQFLTALYYQIDSLYNYGKLKPNAKAVQAAKKELANFAKRDATLGGPVWKPKFEKLKSIVK